MANQNETSIFQYIFIGIFAVSIVLGVAAFALYSAKSGNSVGNVTIWGTVDGAVMTLVIAGLRGTDKSFQNVTYVYKNTASYEGDVVNAMASGLSPDIVLVSENNISIFADKLYQIPYASFPQSTYLSSYVDEAQLFLTSEGILALPLSIDPLVMYWNRDLLASAGVAQPPKYWNGVLSIVPKITVFDMQSNIQKSGISLGGWDNIAYAKEILSTLMMQAGNQIVVRGGDGYLDVLFNSSRNTSSALQFYTEFANPSKTNYSWNRSMLLSRDAFSAGDVAMYFGFASDYQTIIKRNPNLHFGVALLPQIEGNTTHLTYGRMVGLAISRTAPNVAGALIIAQKLSSVVGITAVMQETGGPSVRRDIAQDTSASASATVFAQSALIARGWLDPSPIKTNEIFQTMINSVVNGKSQPSEAVSEASQALQALVQRR